MLREMLAAGLHPGAQRRHSNHFYPLIAETTYTPLYPLTRFDMDPNSNPFNPGAGTPPPELVGRDSMLQQADVAMERIKRGRAERSLVLIGLRGVGKTVLLREIRRRAL